MTDAISTDVLKRLDAMRRKTPAFAEVPKVAARGAVWVEPQLVCEVEFRTWTGSGVMRHASFQGLREDKEAKSVTREDHLPRKTAGPADNSPTAKSPAGKPSAAQRQHRTHTPPNPRH